MTAARKPLLTKRAALLLWLPAVSTAAIVANQIWFTVGYQFGEVTKTLHVTGSSGDPMLNVAVWGGFISLFGVLVSSGRVAAFLSAIGAIASAATLANVLTANYSLATASLFQQVSKLSGIAGDRQLTSLGTSVSDGWAAYTFAAVLVYAFAAVTFALLATQLLVAISASRWPKRVKADRYTKPALVTAAKAKTSTSNDDSISLWDSQR